MVEKKFLALWKSVMVETKFFVLMTFPYSEQSYPDLGEKRHGWNFFNVKIDENI